MRNLKKFLALVLAMMMVFSLMVTVSAANEPDYKGAYDTLHDWGIFKGVGTTDNDDLPGPFSRAQMAAVAYRIATGDVNDEYVDLYKGYSARFKDVDENAWYAGFVGFCASYGIVIGYGDGTFGPNKQVTGVQAALMMLRMLGWDALRELSGPTWEYKVLGQAEKVGMLRGLTDTDSLYKPANRGLAAFITRNASTAPVKQVTYLYGDLYETTKGLPLITTSTATPTYPQDDFGAPYVKGGATTITFNWNYWDTHATLPVKATDDYVYRFYGPETECDIADVLEIDEEITLRAYWNGIGNTDTITIDPLDTISFVGAEGRETSIYKNKGVTGIKEDYIIVFKDVVLAQVGDIIGGINDSAGHEYSKDSERAATVYGNEVMQGKPTNPAAPTAPPAGSATYYYVTNSATTYTVSGNFEKDDWIYSYILTGNTGNTIAGSAVGADGAAAKYRLRNANPITPKPITVKGIIYDSSTSGQIVGFKDANNVEYLYDVSFGYNTADPNFKTSPATSNVEVLDNEDINKEFNVYYWTAKDGVNRVLGLKPIDTAVLYGVVTGQKTVVVDNPNSLTDTYAVQYTVLLPDGSEKPFTAINGNAPFASGVISSTQSLIRKLVKIEVNSVAEANGYAGYYTLAPALDDLIASGSDTVYAYDADTLDKDNQWATPVTVDNNTVFFVAKYVMNNASNVRGAYSTNGYEIINGFQAANFTTDMSYGTATGGIFENGQRVMGYESSTTGNYTLNIDSLDVYAYDADGNALDNNAGAVAKYVLVLNATERTPITERLVKELPNYAYVVSALNQNTVYDDYYEFNVIKSTAPTARDKLDLNNAAGATVTSIGSGLYIYKGTSTNGRYAIDGTGRVNRVYSTTAATSWTYGAGVLTVSASTVTDTMGYDTTMSSNTVNTNGLTATTLPNGWNNKYLTVTDNVPIYIVNQSTGKSVKTTYSLSTLASYYKELYYQVDGYGRINFIWVVDKDAPAGTPTTTSSVTDMTITYTAPTASTSVGAAVPTKDNWGGSFTFTTPATVSATVSSLKVEKLSASGKFEEYSGEYFTAGHYRLVLTLKLTDSAADSTSIAKTATINNGTWVSGNQVATAVFQIGT